MTSTKNTRIADYDYNLPNDRIAKFPLPERDSSKLLIYNKGVVSEDVFTSLPQFLPKGAMMVFNNTKVIQARLHFHKNTGALIEIFCLEPAEPNDYALNLQAVRQCDWYCMIGNQKRWKEGVLSREIEVNGETVILKATKGDLHGISHQIHFEWTGNLSFSEVLESIGELPIPPYLNRETQESDKHTYQTVYSKIKGSVAAPTAGLHFTDRVLKALDESRIDREELTLHVGAGTFKPVKSEVIANHEMHSEYIVVKRQTIEKLLKHGGNAIAVGTTSVRTLESLYYIGLKILGNPEISENELHVNQWEPYETTATASTMDALAAIRDWLDYNSLPSLHTTTQIIIAPGYEFHIVKMMVTNFHQPKSTLLLLISAFVKGDWRKIYDYAMLHDFRFLSYGDSSLLIP